MNNHDPPAHLPFYSPITWQQIGSWLGSVDVFNLLSTHRMIKKDIESNRGLTFMSSRVGHDVTGLHLPYFMTFGKCPVYPRMMNIPHLSFWFGWKELGPTIKKRIDVTALSHFVNLKHLECTIDYSYAKPRQVDDSFDSKDIVEFVTPLLSMPKLNQVQIRMKKEAYLDAYDREHVCELGRNVWHAIHEENENNIENLKIFTWHGPWPCQSSLIPLPLAPNITSINLIFELNFTELDLPCLYKSLQLAYPTFDLVIISPPR